MLTERFQRALGEAFGDEHAEADPVIRPSQFADFQANAALALAKKLGEKPRDVAERVVEHLDQRIITAAGVSSGIDMALRLLEILFDRTAAEASQLMIEYDPQPPFDAGAVSKISEGVMERVIEYASVRK